MRIDFGAFKRSIVEKSTGRLGFALEGAVHEAAVSPLQILREGHLTGRHDLPEAGREAFLAGRMPKKLYTAAPSSPTEGKIAPKAA